LFPPLCTLDYPLFPLASPLLWGHLVAPGM
jgi:hypothetical protein